MPKKKKERLPLPENLKTVPAGPRIKSMVRYTQHRVTDETLTQRRIRLIFPEIEHPEAKAFNEFCRLYAATALQKIKTKKRRSNKTTHLIRLSLEPAERAGVLLLRSTICQTLKDGQVSRHERVAFIDAKNFTFPGRRDLTKKPKNNIL